MKREIRRSEISPIIFPVDKPVDFTLRTTGMRFRFDQRFHIMVQRMDAGSIRFECGKKNRTDFWVDPDEKGELHFTFEAKVECEYSVRVYVEDVIKCQYYIYALEPDLACRIPLRGDFHHHTNRSDGGEDPAIVAANNRIHGLDFLVITDHYRYYPSLQAAQAFKDVKIPLNIIPGEEVHIPYTEVHIVNAGGLFSINGLFEGLANYQDTNGNPDMRRANPDAELPPIVKMEDYDREINEIADSLVDFPEGADKIWYAVCVWAFKKINEAQGLGIFAHPYWISDMFQIPENFTRYMLKNHPFDAFEVIGGEVYYEMNGLQTALYYDEYKYGRVHNIVGSTDSHGSYGRPICSTIVFAKENERAEIIDSVKHGYSVAVDTISTEYRLVGEYRYQKYAAFLMENYFPLHDQIAAVDGELMRRYYLGDATAEQVNAVYENAENFQKKFIVR